MSVFDQFRTAEEQVLKRLRELKPLVEEYHELARIAERLGVNLNEDAASPDEQRSTSAGSAQGRRRSSKTEPRTAASAREESRGPAAAKRSAATTPTSRARARRPGDSGGRGSNRSPRRQQDVLRLVNQRPGITVREIANELGVDPTGLYRPVHELEQEGAISKRGAALQPGGR